MVAEIVRLLLYRLMVEVGFCISNLANDNLVYGGPTLFNVSTMWMRRLLSVWLYGYDRSARMAYVANLFGGIAVLLTLDWQPGNEP
ncbi:hypothetical protein EON65_45210 [archaeon]|nr:MAG: hypothetical protein EON65_45210 [archaeon]